MLNAFNWKGKKGIKIPYKSQNDTDYFIKRVLNYRDKLVKDPRWTEEDIAKYDKHFGII